MHPRSFRTFKKWAPGFHYFCIWFLCICILRNEELQQKRYSSLYISYDTKQYKCSRFLWIVLFDIHSHLIEWRQMFLYLTWCESSWPQWCSKSVKWATNHQLPRASLKIAKIKTKMKHHIHALSHNYQCLLTMFVSNQQGKGQIREKFHTFSLKLILVIYRAFRQGKLLLQFGQHNHFT